MGAAVNYGQKITKDTYEKIYFSLWENAQRYSSFTQFKVIGNSHDDRMIPMLEIGTGEKALFCLGGIHGTDRQMSAELAEMASEFCQAYECKWNITELYNVQKLLSLIRLCIIPILNPDGYEICGNGYSAIRNPIYRQMLRMQEIPAKDFIGNGRGINLRENFPTVFYRRKRMNQEPSSENETKALIKVFQETNSVGLLSFQSNENQIVCYQQSPSFLNNRKSHYLGRHLQKYCNYQLETGISQEHSNQKNRKENHGTPEQYYTEVTRQPAFMVKTNEKIRTLPLEYIFSL